MKNLSFLAASVLAIFFSCNEKNGTPTSTAASAPQKVTVDVLVVLPQYFESKLLVTANLLPYEEVELKAPMAGTVLDIYFKEGQVVRRGEPLLRLDDRLLKAQIKGLEAQLAATRAELYRLSQLKKLEGVSQAEVDQSEANVKNLEASIEQLQVNVSLANVVAPFEGKLGMRNFSVGSYLTQGQTITQLAQQTKLKVDFSVPARYLDDLEAGKSVTVIANGDSIVAKVYAINPVVSSTSRTIQVRAEIAQNTKGFVPGSFAEVLIPLNVDDQALVVPTGVVIPELNSQTVYVKQNGMARRREVELGARTEDKIQILAGLNVGDTVLATGLLAVKDRTAVNVRNVLAN